jgi:hypothetical protein
MNGVCAWNVFCDWYLELPSRSSPERRAAKAETRATCGLGAGPDPEAAASLHALHHRRALAAISPPRRPRLAKELEKIAKDTARSMAASATPASSPRRRPRCWWKPRAQGGAEARKAKVNEALGRLG